MQLCFLDLINQLHELRLFVSSTNSIQIVRRQCCLIDLSMKLSLSEVFVSNIIVTMVISNKSCCKHVLFTNLSDFISTTTRVTSVKSKKFLFCSFSVAKFGIAPTYMIRDIELSWFCILLVRNLYVFQQCKCETSNIKNT